MKIQQIAVFLQNKPGHLGDVCKTLKDNGINIVTLSLADTQQFGILRLIVKDWETAARKLEEAGCLVQLREVVAVEVKDEPGGMFEVLDAIGKGGVNVEYVYAFTFHKKSAGAVLVFRFDDSDKALGALQKAGVNVLSTIDLF